VVNKAPAPSKAANAPGKAIAPIRPAPPARLAGIWRGRAALEGRGICNLRFELGEKGPDAYSGYSSFACTNAAPLMSAGNRRNPRSALLNRMDPDSAILTGSLQNGAIRLHADKTIGTDINGCAVTSFTLTPFGANQLAAEWQAGECQGGHMMLARARR
jgi:hypothetical protein